VDKPARNVRAYDQNGNLLAFYPASIGSEEKPSEGPFRAVATVFPALWGRMRAAQQLDRLVDADVQEVISLPRGARSSSSTLASCKSLVSKPSVDQP
jgi:hypothetical protein